MSEFSFPEIFERSVAAVLREFAASTEAATWVHCTSDNVDYTKDDNIRAFPQILVSASSKYMEGEGTTWAIDISCDCLTWYLDDVTCCMRSDMFRDVESILDRLIYPCRNKSDVAKFFDNQLKCFDKRISFGGFTPTAGGAPQILEGVQVMSYTATIHFAII